MRSCASNRDRDKSALTPIRTNIKVHIKLTQSQRTDTRPASPSTDLACDRVTTGLSIKSLV